MVTYNYKWWSILFLLVGSLYLVFSVPSFGYFSSQSQIYSGLSRSTYNKLRTPIILDWQGTYLHTSGIETYFDMALENDPTISEYSLNAYEVFLTYPFKFQKNPRLRPSLYLNMGRQQLAEGFIWEAIDGVIIPYYIGSQMKVLVYGGWIANSADSQDLELKDNIYGSSITLYTLGSQIKLGINRKQHETATVASYLHLGKRFETFYFKPTIWLKSEFDLQENSFDQGLYTLNLQFNSKLGAILGHSIRHPKQLNEKQKYIYYLFADSPVRQSFSEIHWDVFDGFSANARYELIEMTSVVGKELADREHFYLSYNWNQWAVNAGVSYLTSEKGKTWNYFFQVNNQFLKLVQFDLKTDILHVEKSNGIKGMIEVIRLKTNYDINPDWKSMLAFELENNFMSGWDVRAVLYVAHLYY